MVFTDGTVDIDKILCLHLISAHRAETLTPPSKYYVCKDHSPAEKLIERSQRGFVNHEKITVLLPLYTIGKIYLTYFSITLIGDVILLHVTTIINTKQEDEEQEDIWK